MMRKTTFLGLAAATGALVTAVAVPAMANTNDSAPAAARTANSTQVGTFSDVYCEGGVTNGEVLTYHNGTIVSSQPIVASASEGPFKGEGMNEANVYSQQVTVLNGAVKVRIHTGWGAPLDVCVHLVG